jgi:hypothetical protein
MEMRAAQEASGRPTLALGLLAAGTLCLVAAGGLLWWRRGPAVFEDIVAAAIAWCF